MAPRKTKAGRSSTTGKSSKPQAGPGKASAAKTSAAKPGVGRALPLALPECFDCRFNAAGHPCVGADGQLDYAHIAAAYLANYRRTRAERDAEAASEGRWNEDGMPLPNPDAWSFDCAYEIAQSHPEHLLRFLVAGMDACKTSAEVAYFAAGPVEDALDKHGAALIDRLELMAQRSAKVRYFLSGVWGARRIEPAVWSRIEAVIARSVRMDDDPRTPAHDKGGRIASETDVAKLLEERVVATVGAIAGLALGGSA